MSYQIEKTVKIDLSERDEFNIVWKWVKNHYDVIEKMKNIDRVCCPFLSSCNRFPCETLSCNADTLNNGYPYRMS